MAAAKPQVTTPSVSRARVMFASALGKVMLIAVVLYLVGLGYITVMAAVGEFSQLQIKPGMGSLQLTGIRGQYFAMKFEGPDAIKNNWASDTGLSLALQNSDTGYSVSIKIVNPRPESWGSGILASGDSVEPFHFTSSFNIPTDVPGPAVQTLLGDLRGTITYPAVVGSDQFENRVVDVAIPVRIDITSRVVANAFQRHDASRALLYLLATGAISIVGLTVFSRLRSKPVSKEATTRVTLLNVLLYVGLIAAALLIELDSPIDPVWAGVLGVTSLGVLAFLVGVWRDPGHERLMPKADNMIFASLYFSPVPILSAILLTVAQNPDPDNYLIILPFVGLVFGGIFTVVWMPTAVVQATRLLLAASSTSGRR